MNYGKAIRVARVLSDISQRELAQRLGTDASYISLFEANKRALSRETFEKIAEGLAIPLHLLILMATEQQDTEQPEEIRLSKIAEGLAFLLFAGNNGQERHRIQSNSVAKHRPTGPKTGVEHLRPVAE